MFLLLFNGTVDIEWKDKNINIQEIYELVLSPAEIICFNQLNSEEKFHVFYDIWCHFSKWSSIFVKEECNYPMIKFFVVAGLLCKWTNTA
jgi:hypothetical protein